MQCHEVEPRIQTLLDHRQDPSSDPALNEHAVVCPACRELIEVQSRLFEGLGALAVPVLPPDFSRRVLAVYETRPSPAQRFAPALAALAVAAVLFLAFLAWPLRGPGDQQANLANSESRVGRATGTYSLSDLEPEQVRLVIEQLVTRLTSDEQALRHVDQLAGTIRPLATTLNVAFDAIRRSIPGQRQPQPSQPQAREFQRPSLVRLI